MCWKLWIFYAFFCAILSLRWNSFMSYISGRKFLVKTVTSSRISQPLPLIFHNKWWCNKRLKQFVRSRFQLRIDQVIFGLKSSVNQQRLLADKKLQGTCFGVYFKRFKESSRLRPLRHRYSLTDKIVLTLQVYFATSNGHYFICNFVNISCGSR